MFRKITENDILFLTEISNQCFGENFLTPDYFLQHIQSTTSECWVKIIDGFLTGFIVIEQILENNLVYNFQNEHCWVKAFLETKNTSKTLLIKQVAVHPKFQNKGIASEMIQSVLAFNTNC